ncbi:multidrug MFS transporter [Saccharomonospora sp. CUA-673]|uniref:DHA2 family efflux MFS transporter permease subunit n=1 Tax=Saccharomonospora sp. CUA-673 TaxID=1904969 RepID=UPI00096283E1|nr:DHA2 family efflux MFS transporter permease subunit [Saccharomonospora sp. CUA-673]OLT44719.1 multidrug MFS transporter [Saccharomonospora sp. CUA-673]
MTAGTRDEPVESDRIDGRLLAMALVLVLGTFMASLDATIVNVGLSTLSAEFGATITEVQWASTAYLLAVVAAAPTSGWLAERFGAKRVWLCAVALFLLGSVACALAWSTASLAVFRVLQGLGGGLLPPTGQALLARVAGRARTGRLMSIVGVVPMLAPVFGPLAGGTVLRVADWEWLFLINIPVGLVAMLLAVWLVPRVPASDDVSPFDLRGALLLSPGLAALILGLTDLGSQDRNTPLAVGAVVVGAGLLGAFLVHALRANRVPLVDPRLFRTPPFSAAVLALFVAAASVFGTMFLLPMYLQTGRGLSAWDAGLMLAPQGVGAVLGSLLVVKPLIDRVPPRTLVLTGFTLIIAATVPLTRLGDLPDGWLVATLLVRGLGTAMIASPVMNIVYSGVDKQLLPRASSALSLVNYVGGAIGTAGLAVLLEVRLALGGGDVDAAFSTAFWCVLGLCVLALLGSLRLPKTPPRRT